jgi:hypothetical protein
MARLRQKIFHSMASPACTKLAAPPLLTAVAGVASPATGCFIHQQTQHRTAVLFTVGIIYM